MQTITNCLSDSIACKQANKSSGKVRIFGCIIIVSLDTLSANLDKAEFEEEKTNAIGILIPEALVPILLGTSQIWIGN